MILRAFMFAGLLLSTLNAYADEASSTNTSQTTPSNPEPILPNSDPIPTTPAQTGEESSQTLRYSAEELQQNPDLLASLLDQSIIKGDSVNLHYLLSLYRQLPPNHRNEQLLRFAEAEVASLNGDSKTAIAQYRAMIAEEPDLLPVRFKLAMALMRDRQDGAAKHQLDRLRAETNLPEDIAQTIEQARERIIKRQTWNISASAYYTHDDNINGAPDVRGGKTNRCPFGGSCEVKYPDKKQADGIHANLGAERQFALSGNLYASIGANAHTRWYWNAKEYNDLNLRANVGLGYRNAKLDTSLSPFISRRWYNNQGYATTVGADIQTTYWPTPRWQLNSSFQLSYAKHDTRKWLDGGRFYAGIGAVYFVRAGRYFYSGVNVYHHQTQDKSDQYNRYSANIGWVEDWNGGVSSALSGSIGKRDYAAKDLLGGIKRSDMEYSANLRLWHRNWHLWGITPKLNLSVQQTKSNHFYYDRAKPEFNAYLEFSKTF